MQFQNGADITSLLNVFPDPNGNRRDMLTIKRNSGSQSHSHSKSNSFHSSHSRNNSNNTNHNRNNTSISNSMEEKEGNDSPNGDNDIAQDMNMNINSNTNSNTNTNSNLVGAVTNEQRAQSSKEYARLRDECQALKLQLKQQQEQQQLMAQALSSMQMSQIYGHIDSYPTYDHQSIANYHQQQQFNQAMQEFQQQIHHQQQQRHYQTDLQYIKQEDEQIYAPPEDNYDHINNQQYYSDDKSAIFHGHSHSNTASINQPEFLPQPVPPRYSTVSAPEQFGFGGSKGRGSGPLPPPLKTDAGKERRQSYHDVLSMKQQFMKEQKHMKLTGLGLDELSHTNSVHSLHTNHTNGGNSTLTTASQTTIMSHTNMQQLGRQSTPTTATGMSTPSGSDTSFFSRPHNINQYGGIHAPHHGYNADHKVLWPHNYTHHSHSHQYNYHHGHVGYPPNHTGAVISYQPYGLPQHTQQHRDTRDQNHRGITKKSTSLDGISSHNGSVDVKSVSMASHHNNNNNNNNNNNTNNNVNSAMDLGLPPPPMIPNLAPNSQQQQPQPISPLPKQSNNLLPPPSGSRRQSVMSSSHHSHPSLSNNSNNGIITPPAHSNNNSMVNFDDMNMVANIPSTFSDPVPFDTGAMEMDNNFDLGMNNILTMSGSNLGALLSDAGQISSQSQNRLFMNSVGNGQSVTNMSISGGNGMSMSNSFVDL